MATATQLVLRGQPHRNRGLFSDHYLDAILSERTDWAALADEARPAMEKIAGLIGAYGGGNEAQTEDDLIKPVLALLGHAFEVQAPLGTPLGTKKPDYVLYRNRASLEANRGRKLTEELLRGAAYAVGDAKHWDRPLDVALRGGGGDNFLNANPSYQIAFYMQHAGVEWGILTNGRLWRLYQKDTAHRLDRYYEADLRELATGGDVERFLYFYGFFRRGAFEEGPLGLGALLRGSTEYARGVGESLKQQVYGALRHLGQGFLDYRQNGLETNPDTLREIYDSSLIALYRLLFILYAEARELLPVRESELYRESYSLHAIKRDIARHLDLGRALAAKRATLWPRLKELFSVIDKGDPPLGVATFNGGLFDPERHSFLERYAVGDAHLQTAIDLLARVGPAGNREYVDYRDLAERHLGTIYEGLLEFHLEPIEPEGGWTVALLNDKGERKATGSYYTPDYIVKYIVDRTVGPVLRRAIEGKGTDGEKVEAVLALNVLDPAMGSGHFPVEATEYIARFLVELNVAPEEVRAGGEAELAYWKRRVVQSCIYGVDMNPLAVELAKLSLWLSTVAKGRPLSFLDHHLRPGNALVGARVSELQTGAAPRKTAPDKKGREAAASGQMSWFDTDAFRQSMGGAVGSMAAIEGSRAETVDDVKEQERTWERMREDLDRRYGRLANLATAVHFGVAMDAPLMRFLTDSASKPGTLLPQAMQDALDRVEDTTDTRRFFHWELEFPEVFFHPDGNHKGDDAGFDAVVGNPPYVRQEQLAPYKAYFRVAYPEVYHGMADLYAYFYGRGLSLLRRGRRLGYISSGTFRRLNYGAPLRQHLTSRARLVEIVEFGDEQVFSDVVTYPIILVVEGSPPPKDGKLLLRTSADLADPTAGVQSAIPAGMASWTFASGALDRILKGWEGSGPLRELLDRPIYRGLTTGLNEAFVIDGSVRERLIAQDPASAEVIKPFVRGEDLRPWHQKDSGLWLITLPSGWTRSSFGYAPYESEAWAWLRAKYPALAAHLEPFAEAAGKRLDKGDYWWELRPCNYYDAFEQPRIHSTKVSLFPTFSLREATAYAGNTSYVLPLADIASGYYLLGLLNSRVSEFFCRNVFAPKANGYYEVQPGELGRFPVLAAGGTEGDDIGRLARTIGELATARYDLHRKVRRRILTDLGVLGKGLNQKLTAWWAIDFPVFRAEVQKAFKRDIPLRERDDWEVLLADGSTEHEQLTAKIVRLETDLNARVYSLFDLTAEEIKTVEEATKYRYGEV